MISFIGFQGHLETKVLHTITTFTMKNCCFRQVQCYLLLRFHLLSLHLFDLTGKDGLRLRGRVDAVCLDRDDEVATILQEKLRIQRNNPSLSKIA